LNDAHPVPRAHVVVENEADLIDIERDARVDVGNGKRDDFEPHFHEAHATVYRVKSFNLNGDEWDGTRDREGWSVKGVLVGQRIGGELIGATMSEVEPGCRLWPYHTHHLNEEWVIVLRGEPTLRTPEGERVLKEGDVVCFPRGKDGAHQLINRTDSSVRVLMLSSMIGGEIIEYLDTGKVLAKGVDDEDVMFARPGRTVEYWEGED
jgi:uncharacterized cupin superfamily protein